MRESLFVWMFTCRGFTALIFEFVKVCFETAPILCAMCALLFENVRFVPFISIFLREFLFVGREFLFSTGKVKNFLFLHCMLGDFVILLLAGFIMLYVYRAAKRTGGTEFS